MSGYDKDDLSRFFRKATQKPEIKFNEDDWTKLEAMLDKASAEGAVSSRNRRNKFITVAAITLIVLSGVTYFAVTQPSSLVSDKNLSSPLSLSSDLNKSDASAKNTDSKPLLTAGVTITPASPEENSRKIETRSSMDSEKNGNILTPAQQYHGRLNTTTDATRQSVSGRQSSTNSQVTPRNLLNKTKSPLVRGTVYAGWQDQNSQLCKTTSFENSSITVTDHMNDVFDQKQSSTDSAVSTRLAQQRSIEVNAADKIVPDSLSTPMSLLHKKDSIKTLSADSADHQNEMKPSRWSILLSVAPDFSSNSFQHITNPGEAIGITGYYRIAPKLNVFVGIIGSNKKYLSYGKEYKPKEDHYWSKHTNGMLPTEINGSCFMLEVPIGVQYTAVNMKKNRVLVSGMVSNYTMFNESYTYVFPTENPGAAQGWKSKKTTNYPFSVLGASVSFEHDLSSRLAIGFSPYVKIPLRDMGTWTTMKLYTVGAAVTLRFTFQKAKIPIALPHRERSD